MGGEHRPRGDAAGLDAVLQSAGSQSSAFHGYRCRRRLSGKEAVDEEGRQSPGGDPFKLRHLQWVDGPKADPPGRSQTKRCVRANGLKKAVLSKARQCDRFTGAEMFLRF